MDAKTPEVSNGNAIRKWRRRRRRRCMRWKTRNLV